LNYGYESFESDFNIFNNKISLLMKSFDKDGVLDIVRRRHISEISDEVDKEHKKDDLIIWNAIFSRDIISKGISKKYLHLIYNKYYRKVKEANTINELQQIEVEMIEEYFNFLVNDTEITENLIVNKLLQALYLNIEGHITLEEICENLNISVAYASSSFKKHKGISIMRYLRELKIQRAKDLLDENEKTMLEISLLLGFHDQSHFTKTFKMLVGMSPTEYKNKSNNI